MLSDKIIKSPNTSYNSLVPVLIYIGINTRAKFDRGCLKQDKITFTPGTIVNIYSVYEISDSNNNYPTLKICLLGAVKLTTNADIYKYKYSGYGIGFNKRGTFLFSTGGFGCNVIIFEIDISSSVHFDNKKKLFQSLVNVLHKD